MKLNIVSRKLLALPIIFCLGSNAFAQPEYEWVKCYRGEYSYCHFSDLFATHEAGYAMTGLARIGNTYSGMWLEVVDVDGNELVNKIFLADSTECAGSSIIQTTAGDYVIGGINGLKDVALFAFVVTKIDSIGNPIWWGDYGSGSCYAVIELKDGNIVAAGTKVDPSEARAVMLTPDGEVIWDRAYGEDYDGEDIRAIREVEDALVFAGESHANGRQGWLLKTDFEGEPVWSHTYDDCQRFLGMSTCRDGGFALAGDLWSMVRTDDEGNESWSQQLNEHENSYCWGMTRLWSGDYVLVGYDGNGRVAYVNSQGELQWDRYDGNLPHGRASWRSVVEDQKYRMIAAGHCGRGEGILIRILPVRSPPIIIEATPEASELFVVRADTVTFLVYAEDVQSDTLFYNWYLDDELIDSCATDTSDIVTVTFDKLGDHQVSCFVSDGEYQDSVFWMVRVKELMITGHEPEELTIRMLRNTEIPFRTFYRAAPGDPLELAWTLNGEVVSDADSALIAFPEPGEYRIKFLVSRGEYADSVAWLIAAKELMIADWEPDSMEFSVKRHTVLPFQIAVSAVEEDSITYRWIWSLTNELISTADTALVAFEIPGDFIIEGRATRGQYADWRSWLIHVGSVVRDWEPEQLTLAPLHDTTATFQLIPDAPLSDSLRYLWMLDGDSAGVDSAATLLLTAPARHTVRGYLWEGGEVDSVIWEILEPSAISDPRLSTWDFGLDEPYPNPFNATSVVGYRLPVVGMVSLNLYDLDGRLVQTLAEGWQSAGEHQVTLNGAALPAGVYLIRLQAGRETMVRKAVIIK